MKWWTLLLLILFVPYETESFGVAEATEVISVVRIGVSLVEYIYQVFSSILRDSGGANVLNNVAENTDLDKRLLAEYQVISSSLERLEKGYESIEKNMALLQQKLPHIIRQEIRLDRVDSLMSSIWSSYLTFNLYQDNRDQVERYTLEDFAISVLRHDGDSVKANLQKLHQLIIPDPKVGGILENRGIIAMLANNIMDDPYYTCSLGQSPFHFIYNLYNVLALTEIKGYAMVQFSYMVLRLYGKGNFTMESEVARKTFEKRVEEKLLEAERLLPSVSRKYRRCDPKQHAENKTFIRMKNFLQGHIENEVDINAEASCAGKCSDYNFTKAYTCYNNLFCSKQPKCENGRLLECTYYDADATVCLSGKNDRKYNWIEYEDGTVLGKKKECGDRQHKVDSWWRWLFWHCSYCLCKCDSQSNSDRYWSMRPALSNISANMVVTGVRFVKKMGVIHIEVQQAPATEEGSVNETERHWVEAEGFDVNHPDVRDGRDFMTMTYEERAMDLDTIEAETGSAVTGIRMKKLGGHLNMEIRVTPLDFIKGKLKPEFSIWISNVNTPENSNESGKRKFLEIKDPDVPTNFVGLNEIDSDTNQFIKFDSTSARKDAMQTTIPFIDSQPVSPKDGTWLAGIGLYHKGQEGYGGFLGLMTLDYDFTKHLLPKPDTSRSMKLQLHYDFTPKK